MAEEKLIIEVEPLKEAKDGRPSTGPVYRSLFAKNGFPQPIHGLDSCWDIFSMSEEIRRAGAVEFIICHAEIEIVFVEEKKIAELLKTFPNAAKYLNTIVSFGKVAPQQKEEVDKCGVAIYSWDDFLSLGKDKHFDLPVKKKSDICTIMYTSGTTGDPKGVMISNNSIVALIAGVKCLLASVDEALNDKDVYLSYLPLAHIFDRSALLSMGSQDFGGVCEHGAHQFLQDVKLLVEDLAELKPTIFCAVPRVLERIHTGLQQKIAGGGFLKSTLSITSYYLQLGIYFLSPNLEHFTCVLERHCCHDCAGGLELGKEPTHPTIDMKRVGVFYPYSSSYQIHKC
ncbi:hypothetical protein Leryth_003281 [Lithospermum erythrorhizon]|nr:hypothetical protein Leryth_003281 [Lithospermum erythrorhizon]